MEEDAPAIPSATPSVAGGGEISKNALKKMQKAEENAKKKAEKEAAKAEKGPTTSGSKPKLGGEDGEELDPTAYFENRLKAIDALQKTGVPAYPHKFHVSHSLPAYIEKFAVLADGEHGSDTVSVAGRILSRRVQGKLMFYDLHADIFFTSDSASSNTLSCCSFLHI